MCFRTQFGSSRCGRVTSMFGCQANLRFIIKCYLKKQPLRSVLLGLIYGILFFGFLSMIAESPMNRLHTLEPDRNYVNSCWMVVITMTTVGYGDIFPRTYLGKCTMIFVSLFGIIVVSTMVVIIQNELDFNGPEGNAYTVVRR